VWSVKRSLRAATDLDPEDAPHGFGGLASTITETLALARRDHAVAALLLTKPTFGVTAGIVHMLAITSDDIWGSGQLGVGILFAARGLGALVGPFAARTFAVDDMRRLLRGISISFVIYLVGYAVLPLSPVIWAAALFVFIGHLGGGAQWTLSSFGLQRTTPDRIRGRVFAVDFGLALAISSLSTLTAGWLAGVIGPLPTLYVMLVALALAVGLWFWWTGPVRRGEVRATTPDADPTRQATPEPPL